MTKKKKKYLKSSISHIEIEFTIKNLAKIANFDPDSFTGKF